MVAARVAAAAVAAASLPAAPIRESALSYIQDTVVAVAIRVGAYSPSAVAKLIRAHLRNSSSERMAVARPSSLRGLHALPAIFGCDFWNLLAHDCLPPLSLLNRYFHILVRSVATRVLAREIKVCYTASLLNLVQAGAEASLQQQFVQATWERAVAGNADAADVVQKCHDLRLMNLNDLSAARMQSLWQVAKRSDARDLLRLTNALGLLVQQRDGTNLLSIAAQACVNSEQSLDVVDALSHHTEANYAVLLHAMQTVVDERRNSCFMMPVVRRLRNSYKATWMYDSAKFYINAIAAGKTFVFDAIAQEHESDMLHYLIVWLKFRAKLTPAHARPLHRYVFMRECSTEEKAEKIVRAMHRLIANCAETRQPESLHDVLGDFCSILCALYRKQLKHAFVHRIALDWGPAVSLIDVATMHEATRHYYVFVRPTSLYQRKLSCFHWMNELKALNPRVGRSLSALTLKHCMIFANFCAEQECTNVSAHSLYDALRDRMHEQ